MSQMQQTSLYLMTLVLMLAIAKSKTSVQGTPPKQCLTKGCIIAAAAILDHIDTSISPCSNFYDFVCKKHIERTPLLDDLEKTLFTTRYEEYLAELNVALTKPKSANESEEFQTLRDAYLTCLLNNPADQIQSLADFWGELGGWPLDQGQNWTDSNFVWLKLTIAAVKLNLVDAAVMAPIQKTGVSQPKFSLEINLQGNKRLLKLQEFQSTEHSSQFFDKILMPIEGEERILTEDLNQMFNFAKTVEEILEHKNDEVTVMTLSSLTGALPTIDWKQFFESIYEKEINNNDKIWIQSFGIFKELAVLMETTDKRVLANWYITNIIIDIYMQDFFPPEMKEKLKFSDMEDAQETSRVRYCLHFVYRLSPKIIRGMHTKYFFKPYDKYQIKILEGYIRSEIRDLIQKNSIFTPEYGNLTSQMLKLDNHLDGVDISENYFFDNYNPGELTNCTISDTDHFQNALLLGNIEFKRQIKLLADGNNLNRDMEQLSLLFEYPIFEMNTAQNKSILYLPASLTRGLFFSSDRPHYLNYGMLGFTIAQAIFSSFKNEEYIDDLKGYGFCLQTQYIRSTLTDDDWKTKTSLRKKVETISNDIWGLHLAYSAYKHASRGTSLELLPGLNFTQDQLFWVAYAMTLCQTYDEEEMINNENTVLGQSRVLHAIHNMKQFATDFNCPNLTTTSENECDLPV